MATIEDLLSRIDLPEASGERQIEVIALARGEAREEACNLEPQGDRADFLAAQCP